MATTTYVTLANVKLWLGISSTSEDTNLTQIIGAASRVVDRHTRRRFWVDDAVSAKVFTPEFGDLQFVPDISTATGVVVKTDTTDSGVYDTTWTVDNRTSYGFGLEPVNAQAEAETVGDWPYTRIRALAGSFPMLRYSLQVTALWGWPAVPDDVETATTMLTSRLWKRKDAILGVAGGADVGFIELARRMDPDIQRLLAPYRVLDVAGL